MKTDIFLNRYPTIDLHGFDRESARVATDDFVSENLILKNEIIVIIHGIGSGIVKASVHESLRVNKNVIEYKTDNFNSGCTIIKLKI
ncbi:MAG: Smr/MutS family protein [Bacilli bacterium]|nr:Smr/MutS family protein [Bacilli bacterium]